VGGYVGSCDLKREKDAEIFAVYHKKKDILSEIKYANSANILAANKDKTAIDAADGLPFTNAVHFIFTKTGRSSLISLVIDVNSSTTFAKTWKCWTINCWLRKNYKPSKGITKLEILRKSFVSGFIKGTVYEKETIKPLSSIQMIGNTMGINRLKTSVKLPKFTSGALGLNNPELLNSIRVGRLLDTKPAYFVLDLKP
jgi:hypothetical protein